VTEAVASLPDIWLYIFAFVIGAMLGSFGNVLIWRLPREESVVKPASHCPKCDHKIRFYDNIPILSYLLLRGRCRDCKAPISPRYLLVELASALLFVAAAVAFGWSVSSLVYGILLWALLILAIIDIEHQLLPFVITLPMTYFGLFGALVGATVQVEWALAGCAFGLLFLLAASWIVEVFFKKPETLGEGDIAFAMMAGMYLGVDKMMLMLLLGCVLGLLVMVPLLLFRRRKVLSIPFPFGPFLALSTGIVVFWGQKIINWYLAQFQ
jgi:leader peptidase (prepilin peptidase)/N-methyltransferase